MRISILIHAESPFGHQYGRIFSQRGHDVELLSLSAYEGSGTDVPVKVVGPPGFKPWESSSRLLPYLKTVLPLRRAVRRFAPDILFASYLSSGGMLACLTGHDHIVLSAIGSDVVSRVSSRLWRAIFRWEVRRSVLVHLVSEPLAQILSERIGVPREKMLVAPIGVDTRLLGFVDPADRPGTGRIICTRGHRPVYGQETLVKAIARLKQRGIACHVTFTHAHPWVKETRRLVGVHGVEDRVTFIPGFEAEELPSLLAGADVYVSASYSDGTSVSLLECLSTGTFPVVSDIPANRPWVEHGRNGLLFPPGDDEALADRLAEALARPELRAAAAPISRRIAVEKADIYGEADRLLAAFESCLNE